ncbi:MAG: glycosyltransferase family 9 protein [Verrucomicrobiales bacterium]|nr:glycosyltransferase family 9 protein [Verrucomicrobiales bacterium]
MNLRDVERILIVKPSSLGDIVHTIPAVESLSRSAPQAKINWLANTEWCPILDGIPFLHEVIPFPRREFKGFFGLFRAAHWADQKLRFCGYDLVIDFQGLFRSAYLAASTKANRVVGFEHSREGAAFFYNEKAIVENWHGRHAVDRNLDLVASLGVDVSSPTFLFPAGEEVRVLPDFPVAPVLLHPFSRGLGKSLSIPEVRELCEQLAPHPVLLVGIPEQPLSEMWPGNVIDLLGKTNLRQLLHLLRLAAWTVSVDSGPMHLAAGISDRVLSIHTWSNPAMVGPWRKSSWIWRESRLVQVGDLDPDRFPEQRDRQKFLAAQSRILAPNDITALTDFLHRELKQGIPS